MIDDPLLLPAQDLPLDNPDLEARLQAEFFANTYYLWFHESQEAFPQEEQELAELYGAPYFLATRPHVD